ncbi:MAG TPA: MFS transporter [Paracoccus solventivorans]|uniref:MFS transporter n=1 Tax=Paracoccus solventivorans TaxID=53463 RepID=A0A832QX87_9RHOB|nr:MFS transporter [Paracoccus solventivorans]
MTRPSTSPSLLRDPVFRRLWATVELSFLGGFVHVVASAWLISLMSDNATMVALTQTAYGLPMVIFSIFAGAMADTYDRRKTMIWALGFSIFASALLAVAAGFGLLGSWSTLTLLFLVGIGVAIFTPSWQASLGTIVDRDRLGEAVSLHNMGANVMRTVGPALGGFLVTFTSATFTFLVGAFSYLPALIVLIFWKPQTTPVGSTRESVTSAVGAGIRFLAASPAIQPIFLRVFCFSTSAISVMALLPLIVRDQFGGDATDYGILFGAFGLGAILGGFAQGLLRHRYDSEWMLRRAFLINAAAIAVLAVTNNFVVGLLATGLAGSCWLMSHSLQNTTLQLATPRWMVGRMVSICLTATFLGISAGSWLWGVVTEYSGTEFALTVSAIAMSLTWLLALRFPLPETRNLILEPMEKHDLSIVPTLIEPQAGPVQIMVEHRVAEGQLPEFHRLMGLRRRHLIQLGARHWTLLDPLDGGTWWIESFQFPTWADYQRLLQRRTTETVSLREEIRAVQYGKVDPVMRRFMIRGAGPARDALMPRL